MKLPDSAYAAQGWLVTREWIAGHWIHAIVVPAGEQHGRFVVGRGEAQMSDDPIAFVKSRIVDLFAGEGLA